MCTVVLAIFGDTIRNARTACNALRINNKNEGSPQSERIELWFKLMHKMGLITNVNNEI